MHKYHTTTQSLYNLLITTNPINIMNTVSITVPHRGILPTWGWVLATGRLTPTGHGIDVPAPVCILFPVK